MKDKITKLIDVKSLITLGVVGVYLTLTCMGKQVPQEFNSILMLILGTYFGVKSASSK